MQKVQSKENVNYIENEMIKWWLKVISPNQQHLSSESSGRQLPQLWCTWVSGEHLDKSKSFDTLILFWCSESDIPAQSTGSFTMIRCTKTHMQPLSSSLHRMNTQVYRSSSTITEYKSKKTFLPPQSAGISKTFHFPFSNLGRWDTV